MHVKGLTNGLGVGEGLLEEATAGKPTKIDMQDFSWWGGGGEGRCRDGGGWLLGAGAFFLNSIPVHRNDIQKNRTQSCPFSEKKNVEPIIWQKEDNQRIHKFCSVF